MPIALTYQSGPHKSEKRTVVVEDVRQASVLLPTGRLDVISAKLLHGTTCAHSDWAEWLGTDAASDDFVIPVAQLVAKREMKIAVRAHHKEGK